LNEEYSLGMVSRERNVRLDRVALETRLDANEQSTFVFIAVLHYIALKHLVDYKVSGFSSNDDSNSMITVWFQVRDVLFSWRIQLAQRGIQQTVERS